MSETRYTETGAEISGPNAVERRNADLEIGNRTLVERNAALTRELNQLLPWLDEMGDQAGIFIGVATQARVRERTAALRAFLTTPPKPIPQLEP